MEGRGREDCCGLGYPIPHTTHSKSPPIRKICAHVNVYALEGLNLSASPSHAAFTPSMSVTAPDFAAWALFLMHPYHIHIMRDHSVRELFGRCGGRERLQCHGQCCVRQVRHRSTQLYGLRERHLQWMRLWLLPIRRNLQWCVSMADYVRVVIGDWNRTVFAINLEPHWSISLQWRIAFCI